MVQILHNPFGQGHPYEQLPEERFPRLPLAGQPFTVGAVTRPVGAARTVQLHYQIGDGPISTVEAECQPDWKPALEEGAGAEFLDRIVRIEQDIWHARIEAPATGEVLTYWLTTGDTRTPDYAFVGEDWQRGGSIIAHEPTSSDTVGLRAQYGKDARTADSLPVTILGLEWLSDGQTARRVRITFDCADDEAFFGLGERFNALDQRGNTVDIRVYEQYKNQGSRTYLPIPFLLSSRGYGLFVNSSRWMQFDLARSAHDRWTLEADLGPEQMLDLVVFRAGDPLEIIGRFAQWTGPVALPPLWAFGLWMSGNEWNTQARVLHEVAESFKHGVQPSVLVIEAWSDETTFYIWNDARYEARSGDQAFRYSDFSFPEEGMWPDPKAMVDSLHERGIRLLLWQIPVLKALEQPHPQHEADRAYFEQAGFGVRQPDGDLYRVRPFWFRDGYLWDVTNPAARDWWLAKRRYLLQDLGVDGFKTDGGEHLWGTEMQFHDGREADEVWNEYPRLYSEAYYTLAQQEREGDALVFSRAGFTGSQRSPAHWAGDENSTWDAFRHTVIAGLSAASSGIPFWGWDLGGFSGEIPTSELYLRGAAMAAFCPIMQYHSEFNQHREPSRDRTPWNIAERTGDPQVIETFRFLVNVRHNLMPYIWQEARHTAQTGQPLMRALRLLYRDASPYQYFFGRDLLVCPVVEEGTTVWQCYLPPGGWNDLWTGEPYQGGQPVSVAAPLNRVPVFVRAGAAIPVRLGQSGKLGEFVPLSAEANQRLSF